MFRSLLCFTLFIISISHANAADVSDFTAILPNGTNHAFIIGQTSEQDPGAPVTPIKYNETQLMAPASTQKMITALAAKLYLTDSFVFQTELRGITKQRELHQTEFVFSGDPSFRRQDLTDILRQLKRRGITRISGDIKLNTGHFNGYNWSNGQVWNDQGVCYSAPASAIIINHNCVQGNLKRSELMTLASVYIPNYEPLRLNSKVSVVSKEKQKKSFCELELKQNGGNNYTLFGCIRSAKRNLPLSFAITDPSDYFSQILRAELKSQGIQFSGDFVSTDTSSQTPIVITHKSPPLDELINTMLKDSDNLIADVLFKTMGGHYFEQPGNYRNGARAMQEILATAGIDMENSYIADGSGLSRHNLISAQKLFDILTYIAAHDDQLGLLKHFAISGVDGSMQYKKGLLTPLLKGNIRAKTGSMKGVSNLVGFATTKQNKSVPFVLMINNYNLSQAQKERLLTDHQPSPLTQYFTAFFSYIVKSD